MEIFKDLQSDALKYAYDNDVWNKETVDAFRAGVVYGCETLDENFLTLLKERALIMRSVLEETSHPIMGDNLSYGERRDKEKYLEAVENLINVMTELNITSLGVF